MSEVEIEKTRLRKDDIIKKMIRYIEVQAGRRHSEKNLEDLLEVFSLMIHQSSAQRREIQDIFNSNRATEMVLYLLSSTQQYEAAFFDSLMRFCNAILSGKNRRVQRTIYKHFRASKQTERSFARLSASIANLTHLLREGTRRPEQSTQAMLTCSEVLRFVVLCCEGHYSDMQHYFRVQPNLSVQHNFVKEVVDLLSVLSIRVCREFFDPMMLAFDALTELVQGPNRANQDFLLKGPILELLSNLLMHSPGQSRTRASPGGDPGSSAELTVWQTRKLKQKAVVLLQGLCELADNPTRVFSRFSKFLPIFLLLVYLEESYLDYRAIYGTQELVLHSLNKVGWASSSTTRQPTSSTCRSRRRLNFTS